MPIRKLVGAIILGLGIVLAATLIQMYGTSLLILTRVSMVFILVTLIGTSVYRGINLGRFVRNFKKAASEMGEYSFMLVMIFFLAGTLFIFAEGPTPMNLFYGGGGFIALYLSLKKRWPEEKKE